MHPVDERHREIVAEAVDQAGAVDQVLGGEVELLLAGREIDQVGVEGADPIGDALLPGARLHVGQGLAVDVDAAHLQAAAIVGPIEHVEDLALPARSRDWRHGIPWKRP